MASLRETHTAPPPCSDEPRVEETEDKKKLVLIYHDESIYNNEGQTCTWGEEERPALLPKTKGGGVMVLEFVTEYDDYLALSEEQHVRAHNSAISQSA